MDNLNSSSTISSQKEQLEESIATLLKERKKCNNIADCLEHETNGLEMEVAQNELRQELARNDPDRIRRQVLYPQIVESHLQVVCEYKELYKAYGDALAFTVMIERNLLKQKARLGGIKRREKVLYCFKP